MPLDPRLDPLFEAAGKQYDVDPALLRAVALTESSGKPNAVSPAGAQGLMQLMPGTARDLGVADPFDPSQAIPGAARYLSQGLDKYGDPVKALMFYHGGPDEGIWGQKTQSYPHAVASYYAQVNPITVQPLSSEAAPNLIAAAKRGGAQIDDQGRIVGGDNSGVRMDPALLQNYARSAKPMNGIEQLAAAGQPQGTQLAQAPGMSDEELLKGFVDWSHPFLPQPSKAAQPIAQAPSQPQAQPAQPGGQTVLGPKQLIEMINLAGKAEGGIAAMPGLASALEKMLSEGTQFVYLPDGSIGMGTIGGATGAMRDVNAAKAAGTGLQAIGPNGVSNMPGAVASAAEKAGAVKGAESAAAAPYQPAEVRPGNIATTAQGIHDATKGVIPGGPQGGGLYNNPSVGKNEEEAAATFGKHREAFLSNQSAAQNLQNFLDAASAVGTGKGTELSAHSAAWLKSIGVDPQKLSLADPAEVEKMRKASTQMIFQQIRGVSSRPAYQEFTMLAQGNPNPDLQPEANRAIAGSLLGRMQWENQLFKDWDAARRGGASIASFDLPSWAEGHPMPGFQASAYANVPAIPDRGVLGHHAPAPGPDRAAVEAEMRRRGLLK